MYAKGDPSFRTCLCTSPSEMVKYCKMISWYGDQKENLQFSLSIRSDFEDRRLNTK